MKANGPTDLIKAEIERVSKTLDKNATSRWKHGYVDGLRQALKYIERENEWKRTE